VTVTGGPNTGAGGGNVYTVTNTANNSTNPLTTLNVGNAQVATVDVQATSGPLTVTMSGGSEQLNVGFQGSVQGIHGALTFNSAPAPNTVSLDDSADGTGRTVTINDTSVVGLAPAVINYQGHMGIDIRAGGGANTFTINGNSGSASQLTDLQLGSGNSAVNVRGTTEPLDIFQGSGPFTTTIGSLAPGLGGTVANIHGAVFVGNFGSTSLVVDDSADPTARTVDVGNSGARRLTGLAPVTISYEFGPLTIRGGSGGNTFNVTEALLACSSTPASAPIRWICSAPTDP
jgi:hypothetical protein